VLLLSDALVSSGMDTMELGRHVWLIRMADTYDVLALRTDDHLPGLIEHAIEANLVLSGVLSSHVGGG